MKILVIDDEKPTLSMFKLFLTAYGYEVYTAEDGEKGLSMFEELRPQIVFTDIKMPGIDGLEVVRRIRKTGIDAQVIIITGHGDMETAVKALDLDASDFINKPVERQALNAALARAEKRKQMPGDLDVKFIAARQNNCLEVSVKGKLTASSKEKFLGLFKDKTADGIHKVRLIFDESFSIDSSGISLLIGVIQDLMQKEITVFLENLSYNYVRVFQMAGMDKMATLKESFTEE
ncbi:MAG: response regulator [Desulfobacteraceae bacterium]|nr:response regulator [Desulfobacteraceae bacterium]